MPHHKNFAANTKSREQIMFNKCKNKNNNVVYTVAHKSHNTEVKIHCIEYLFVA